MKIYNKKFYLNIIFACCAAMFAALFAFSLPHGIKTVKADNGYQTFLPFKSEEYYALSSPIHAYSDDEITAVTTTDKQLLIFGANDTLDKITSTTPLKQITRFGEYLLYSDNLTVTAVKINDKTQKTKLSYVDGNNDIKDLNNVFFDATATKNGFIVATTNNQQLQLFYINELLEVSLLPHFLANSILADDAPVAVNSENVFYISGNTLHKKSFDNLEFTQDYSMVSPSFMIADENNLYYIDGTSIYRLSVKDNVTTKLNFADNGNYDLGKIVAPNGLAFKNGNLLIIDGSANGSVQEFKINGDTLEFTGYAIASGLSAYNRVAANASDIERYGNYVAALDNKKLTVINTERCTDYDKNGFINKFIVTDTTSFALGNGTILYSNGAKVYLADVAEDAKDNVKQIDGLPTDNAPNDISYQSGVYYLIYLGTNSKIVKIDEKTKEITENDTDKFSFNGVAANLIATDVFGNVYAAYGDKIYKNSGANSVSVPSGTAKKLCSDLAGNLFVLSSNGKIYRLDANANAFTPAPVLDVTGTLGNIKTFGLNFDSKELFFLIGGKEQVYYSTDAGNVSIKDVVPTDEFNAATTGKTDLALYTVNDGANVYSVRKNGDAFDFNGLAEKAEEYPLIAKLDVANIKLYALASDKGAVLVNESDLIAKGAAEVAAPEKAYITTSVYAYAIPVIEKDGTFAMTKSENKIRLNKGEEISVSKAYEVLNKTFYAATAKLNGEDLPCYIPADFTATILTDALEFTDFTIEKVKQTPLFANADLTEEIIVLESGEQVKLLSRENGVLKIAAKAENSSEIIGYIPENALAENPNTIVRNVLIILAVFGSLAGTVSFFLLRKKQ